MNVIVTGKRIVRGLYDYISADAGGGCDDLNFRKDDVMEIITE